MKCKYLLFACVLLTFSSLAQQKTTVKPVQSKAPVKFTEQDSLDAIRELLSDLSFLVDSIPSNPYSYGSFYVGVGNGYFRERHSATEGSSSGKIYYSATGNYFHKSGLGLTLSGLMLPQLGKINLFQTTVSPSYDYTRSKVLGAGIAYTHYFIKDSLNFETSPLVNEYYGYVSYKKSKLRPMIGVNYATGTIHEHIPANSTSGAMSATTNVNDVTLIGSLQYYTSKKGVLTQRDQLSFAPALLAVAGTTRYGTNLSIETLGKVTKHYNNGSSGNGNGNSKSLSKKEKKNNSNGNGNGGSGSGGTTTNMQSVVNTDFQMQGVTLVLGGNYSIKKYYLQPKVLIDYSIQAEQKKINALFNATLGLNF